MEQSKGGLFAKELRATVKRLAPMMGFTLKVVENAGSSLAPFSATRTPGQARDVEETAATLVVRARKRLRIAKSRTSYTNLYAKSATRRSRSQGHL